MIDLSSKKGIEALANVKDPMARKRLVRKYPEVIIYACKYWYKPLESYQFSNLVKLALSLKPELITNFKGKNGLVPTLDYIKLAIQTNPMVMAQFSKEMKEQIQMDMFIDAFVENPLVLTIPGITCLKDTIFRTVKVDDHGQEVEKKIRTTLRTECLKAIRLSEGVSRFHKGYDNFALHIAKKLQKSKSFQKNKYSPELLKNFATLMNVMIKKKNQNLRVIPKEAWLVNNGKPAYKATRDSVKDNSELGGLLGDFPEFDEEFTKRLIIVAIKVNPNVYLDLNKYGLGKYQIDATVQYNVLKSLKKHGMLKKANEFLSEDALNKAQSKLKAQAKIKEAREQEEKTM